MGKLPHLLFALTLLPGAASAQSFPTSSVSMATRPNGLRVVVKHNAGEPLVALSLWVKAGARNETPENNGVAHLLEHYLFGGDSPANADPFDRAIEAMGGVINAETNRDDTHFYITVPRAAFEPALKILAQMIRHPAFDATQLEQERKRAAAEVQQHLNEPDQLIEQALFSLAYKVSAYRLPTAGSVESVNHLTSAQIKSFYNSYYRPDNASLVIVGDFSLPEVTAVVGPLFDDWPRGVEPIPPVLQEPARDTSPPARLVPLRPGATSAIVAIGFPAPSATQTKDSMVMDLIETMLTVGQHSLLNEKISKPGILSDTGGDYLTSRDPGLLLVWGTTPLAGIGAARQKVVELVQGLMAGNFTDADVERARRSLLGSYALQNETAADQNSGLGYYEAIVGNEYAVKYESMVASITRSDIRRVAHQYFGAVYTAIIGPPGTPV